jgi:hypothetical protein
MGVTWPIMVLNAKLVMVAMETPSTTLASRLRFRPYVILTLDRVLVSKISAGTIPESHQLDFFATMATPFDTYKTAVHT